MSSGCLLDTAPFHCQAHSNPQGFQTVQSGKQIHNDLLVLGGLSGCFKCQCELETFMMKSGRKEEEEEKKKAGLGERAGGSRDADDNILSIRFWSNPARWWARVS